MTVLPLKQRVSDWKKASAAIQQKHADSVRESHKRAKAPKHRLLEDALAWWFISRYQ